MIRTSTSGISRSNETRKSNSTFSKESAKENDGVSLSEVEEDATALIVLSVIYQGNKLGAAYYDLDTSHLYLMPDHIDAAPSFSLLRLLLRQTQPSHIVTSQRMDENLLNVLREINNMGSATTDSTNSASREDRNKLHLLPNIDFALEASKHRLQTLQLLKAPQNMNDLERKIHLSSLIDFTSACMIKAAGGLLKFVEKSTFGLSLENSSSSITGISTISLKNILNIDDNSYRALQIFQEERHPSVYKSSLGRKEGLSLYGICNKCKSAIGKKELKRWFLMPTNDPEVIKMRQAAIKFFISSKNADVLNALQGSLKHIKFLPRMLTRMKTAQATMTDWQALYKTSYHAMLISDIARSRTQCLEIFKEISNSFSTDLFRIASLLNKIIDFEEYAKQNHFVVKPGVDSELDKMKRTYNGLPDFMTQVAYQELEELSIDIPQCSVIYLPQLGYLLAIPVTEQMKESKDYSIPNLRFMFITNDVAHYKSNNTKKLDSLLGDTLCDIYDKETQIMHKLQNVILEMKPVLFDVMEYSAKLDCLIALSVVAKEYDWIQPEISTDGELAIVKGRHPLQEICVSSFVGNNVFSGGSESKIKILTGPNSSGKSIYLKQVALLIYMSHLGSFIPAQRAKIPAFDNIFTCINATESVSLNLSSFLISLNQLSYALNKASQMSLVVIDEFGKYTEAESGEALVIASLQFWMLKGLSSPHIFLATHFLNLSKHFSDNPLVKFQTMDITIENDLIYLYQLVDGIASSSLASHTALRAGMPKECIERSMQILQAIKTREPILPLETHHVHDKLKRYFSIINEFLHLDMETYDVGKFLQFVRDTAQISQSPSTSNASSSNPRRDVYSS